MLPETMFINPIYWELPSSVSDHAPFTPPGCLPHRSFIKERDCSPLMHSIHASFGTGQPGIVQTLSLLQDRFWWLDMVKDVRRYVKGCPECAISRTPRHLPVGKVMPLPIPQRPWSHLGVDFLTDLPNSGEHTCILVVVDRFSKGCQLIPLRSLSTAMITAELLFNLPLPEVPEDIVSDQGSNLYQESGERSFVY